MTDTIATLSTRIATLEAESARLRALAEERRKVAHEFRAERDEELDRIVILERQLDKMKSELGIAGIVQEAISDAALASQPDAPVDVALPADVVELVIAARYVMDQGDMSEEHRQLDRALMPFSALVPYDDEPDDAALSDLEERQT